MPVWILEQDLPPRLVASVKAVRTASPVHDIGTPNVWPISVKSGRTPRPVPNLQRGPSGSGIDRDDPAERRCHRFKTTGFYFTRRTFDPDGNVSVFWIRRRRWNARTAAFIARTRQSARGSPSQFLGIRSRNCRPNASDMRRWLTNYARQFAERLRLVDGNRLPPRRSSSTRRICSFTWVSGYHLQSRRAGGALHPRFPPIGPQPHLGLDVIPVPLPARDGFLCHGRLLMRLWRQHPSDHRQCQ